MDAQDVNIVSVLIGAVCDDSNSNSSSNSNSNSNSNNDNDKNDNSGKNSGKISCESDKIPTVRVFLSSTFTDTEQERNILMQDVFPLLREYGTRLGLVVHQPSDLRWGVSQFSVHNHDISSICVREIERCHEESDGIYFVVLLSQKYSFRPVPSQIDQKEFETILHYLNQQENNEGLTLLGNWYSLDTNCVPPTYILQSIDSHTMKIVVGVDKEFDNVILPSLMEKTGNKETLEIFDEHLLENDPLLRDWFVKSTKTGKYHMRNRSKLYEDKWFGDFLPRLQKLLRAAASAALSGEDAWKYIRSVTETEVKEGILDSSSVSEYDKRERTFYFRRLLTDIPVKEDVQLAKKYIDILPNGNVDEEAQDLLSDLRDNRLKNIMESSSRIITYDVKFPDYISIKSDKDYLKKFAADFTRIMMENMDKLANKRAMTKSPPSSFIEVKLHSTFLNRRLFDYVSTDASTNAVSSILSFVTTPSSNFKSDSPCFVLASPSGCGKTTIMAAAIKKCISTRDSVWKIMNGGGSSTSSATAANLNGPVIIYRFLGTTPNCASSRSLMKSIIEQLKLVYGNNSNNNNNNNNNNNSNSNNGNINSNVDAENGAAVGFAALKAEFQTMLNLATVQQPLIIFFDSLDQLSDEDQARKNLSWLPSKLNPNVRLVVSLIPIIDNITLLENVKQFYKLKSSKKVFEVQKFKQEEFVNILDKWMVLDKKSLTNEQKKVIQSVLQSSPTPITLRVAFDLCKRWRSYDKEFHLNEDIRQLISQLFDYLENRYGKTLVNRALSYLTIARSGLGDDELDDLLSLNDDVLNEIFEWWTPPIRRLPSLLWARISSDLGKFLTKKAASGGKEVKCWYHRQFIEAATARYLSDPEELMHRHREIAEYFLGIHHLHKNGYDRKVPAMEIFTNSNDNSSNIINNNSLRVNHRKLEELAFHLKKSIQISFDELVTLLTDLKYIEAKCLAGLALDLPDEYAFVCEFAQSSADNSTYKLSNRFMNYSTFVSSNLFIFQNLPEAVIYRAALYFDESELPVTSENRPFPKILSSSSSSSRNDSNNNNNNNNNGSNNSGFSSSSSNNNDEKKDNNNNNNSLISSKFTVTGTRAIMITAKDGESFIIAVVGEKNMKRYSAKTGLEMNSYYGHRMRVYSIWSYFDEKGDILIGSTGNDGFVIIWNLDGSISQLFDGADEDTRRFAMRLGSTGRYFDGVNWVAFTDGSLRSFDVGAKKIVSDKTPNGFVTFATKFIPTAHDRLIMDLSVSGDYMATIDRDGILRIRKRKNNNNNNNNSNNDDGELLPLVCEKNIFKGKENGYGAYHALCLDIRSDDEMVACGGDDYCVQLYQNLANLTLVASALLPNDCTDVVFDPNSHIKNIAVGCQDRIIRIFSWNVNASTTIATTTTAATPALSLLFSLKGHVRSINSLEYSTDAKYLISGSEDKTVKVWDLTTANVASTATTAVDISTSSPTATTVANPESCDKIDDNGDVDVEVAEDDLDAKMFELANFEPHRGPLSFIKPITSSSLPSSSSSSSPLASTTAIANDGIFASSSEDRTIKIWRILKDENSGRKDAVIVATLHDIKPKSMNKILGNRTAPLTRSQISVSPSGNRITTTSKFGDGGSVLVYIPERKGKPMILKVNDIKEQSTFASYFLFSDEIVAGLTKRGMLMIWDTYMKDSTKKNVVVAKHYLSPPATNLSASEFDNITGLLAVASATLNSVVIYKIASPSTNGNGGGNNNFLPQLISDTGKQLHSDLISSVTFSNSTATVTSSNSLKLVASGSRDGTIRIWDLEKTKTAVAESTRIRHGTAWFGGVTQVIFRPDNMYLASSSRDGTVKIFLIQLPKDIGATTTTTSPTTINLQLHHTLCAQTASITTISYFNNDTLLSGSVDETICLWDMRGMSKKIIHKNDSDEINNNNNNNNNNNSDNNNNNNSDNNNNNGGKRTVADLSLIKNWQSLSNLNNSNNKDTNKEHSSSKTCIIQ